ncbi:DNA-binding response regulator [Anaerocolumna cellulosilytica]|uniref:Stage 0 sporulation protein A homolog n=1 Tax=Anaerocolumna cellulosilytica TaxID=433286 RepID=A0A6S6QW58_9FIRM|nr:response regulator transcription factor [Anaerocolumna cellulosilytica]MBB5194356.1 DNA-binding NarL/FixJ family response regulator [Anaerocolumna cellulosilytica]BCJ93299.1 DNA-binding response regulator [Anaerocolumna cellulosilytica]
MINVLIADDQKLFRESIKHFIELNGDFKVNACVNNGKEAFESCKHFLPDVILMDLIMPICDGIEATKLIKEKYPDVKILILTASNEGEYLSNALNNGADGYIIKDIGMEELILSIKSTAAGLGIIHKNVIKTVSDYNQSNTNARQLQNKTLVVNDIPVTLNDRELHIIQLIVDGHDNKQIAEIMFMAEGTIKNKIAEINSKLQVKDRTQLAVYAIKNNII